MNPLNWLRIGGALVALAAVGWLAYTVNDWHTAKLNLEAAQAAQKQVQADYDAYRTEVSDSVEKYRQRLVADEEITSAAQSQLDAIRGERDRALTALRSTKPLTVEVPNGSACPDTRLSGAFGLCYLAAKTGDPADIAACQAGRVRDGDRGEPVPPPAVVRHGPAP